MTNKEQAKILREQVLEGGLRFQAYLPPSVAIWIIDLVADGIFEDPSEAVFVMMTEQQELEPHKDLREELFKRRIQASIDSIEEGEGIPHEEFMTMLEERLKNPIPKPATWEKY